MTQERMAFRAEVSRLLDIVVHSLYSEKEIFLRELVSNASDACDRLRYEAVTQPDLTGEEPDFSIRITVDPKARTLTVSDNGVGMTRDELVENLGIIAQSGTSEFLKKFEDGKKPDVSQIGQFGVGFYSAFMVAQMVEVTSRKAGTAEAWAWESDGRGEFTVEEAERSGRGTDVTLYLKQGEDEFLQEDRLRAIVRQYSDHIALPVFVGDGDAPANRASALWQRAKSEITSQQYKEFYHHVAHAFDEPAMISHWKAEGKIEYAGLLFVPGTKPYDLFDPKRRHGVKLYVKRVFITDEAEGLVPSYLRFLRGVIDSEDLPLNVSREMLQHNPLLAKIRHGVVRRVIGDLQKLSEDKPAYAAFWDNFGAVVKEGLYEDGENRDSLLEIARFRSTASDGGLVSLEEYVARMKNGQEAIYYINGDDPNALARSPHLEGFRARGIEVLLLTDAVDDFWTGAVGEHKGKKFASATRAGQDMEKFAATSKDETAEKPPEASISALIALMKVALGDEVKDVRTSSRLTESPACLAADEGDIDIHLERFLRQHNQIRTPSKRIFEINPDHALIRRLAERSAAGSSPQLEDAIRLLLDQARLLGGEPIPDPLAFGKRLNESLERAI